MSRAHQARVCQGSWYSQFTSGGLKYTGFGRNYTFDRVYVDLSILRVLGFLEGAYMQDFMVFAVYIRRLEVHRVRDFYKACM